MIGALACTLLLASLVPLVARRRPKLVPWFVAVPTAWLVGFFLLATGVVDPAMARSRIEWLPALGITFSLSADGLSRLFGILISGVGALVIPYAAGYSSNDRERGRLIGMLLTFMVAMLGVVLAADLITLFVFWEATSVISFLLVAFKSHKAESRASARRALLTTGLGGLALLAAILLMGRVAGSYDIVTIVERGEILRNSQVYPGILVGIALAVWTKSAQFPFHGWLPGAMAAPTPVSTYLHSATLVKAGVYLLARLDPALGGTSLWVWLFVPIGAFTMVYGAVVALTKTDMKQLLAFSTVSALGMLVALLGLSFEMSVKAALTFVVVHALYKAALFMMAGEVEHRYGTRDLRELGGLRSKMPAAFVGALVAGLSMAGLPPLIGFVGKELAYKAKLGTPEYGWVLVALAIAANAANLILAGKIVLGVFSGPPRPALSRAPREASRLMVMGPLVLAALSLGFGLMPGWLAQVMIEPATAVVLGYPVVAKLSLWYGIGPALITSIATVSVGLVGLWQRRALVRGLRRFIDRVPSFSEIFVIIDAGLVGSAGVVARALGRVGTRSAVAVTVLAPIALVLVFSMLAQEALEPLALLSTTDGPRPGVGAWAISAALGLTSLAVAVARRRLAALFFLGALGYAMVFFMLWLGAPDLALTQFLVDTLFVTVLLFALRGRRTEEAPPAEENRVPRISFSPVRLLAAIAFGGFATCSLLLAAHSPARSSHVAEFFAAQSVELGQGRNIVNVILVDFRALDTLGEVTVLALAALGVGILARRAKPMREARISRRRKEVVS